MGRHSSEQTFRDDSNLFTSTRANFKHYITTSCDWINILPRFSQPIAVVPFFFPALGTGLMNLINSTSDWFAGRRRQPLIG